MSEQPQLTLEHQQAVRQARLRSKRIRRAVNVARIDAWTMALTLLSVAPVAIFRPSLLFIAATAAVGVITYQSFRGMSELQRYQPRGARRLGYNQIGLCALVCVYCIYSLITVLTGKNEITAALRTWLTQMSNLTGGSQSSVGNIDQQIRMIGFVLYGSVIGATVLTQGLMALYYFSRGKVVQQFLEQTPDWVIELLRA